MSNNPQYPGLQPLRPPGPPIAGSLDPQRSFVPPPMPGQYRPVVPTQQPQQFMPMPSQHYPPVGPSGPMMNVGMPPQNQQPQFPQPIQQLPPRSGQQLQLPPQPQPLPLSVARPNMHMTSESMMPQPDSQVPNGYAPSLGGPGMPLPASYTFGPSSYGQVQTNFSSASQFHPASQIQAPSSSSSQSITSDTVVLSNDEKPSTTSVTPSATSIQPSLANGGSTDWIEHTSSNGVRYYYNKKTKVSSWERPFELMTPIERVDATTNWKEYTSPNGIKYYYNKVTRESKWMIPEELKVYTIKNNATFNILFHLFSASYLTEISFPQILSIKLARQQVEKAVANGTHTDALPNSHTQPSVTPPVIETAPTAAANSSLIGQGEPSSPVSVAPVVSASTSHPQSEMSSGPSASPHVAPITGMAVAEVELPVNTATISDAAAGSDRASVTNQNDGNNFLVKDTLGSADEVPAEDKEDGKNDSLVEKTNDVASETKADTVSETRADLASETQANVALETKADASSETKTREPLPLVYANKMEAKEAFKALIESVNVGSDWTWDRTMRLIVNDKRYGALKSLGEKKQAFNEESTELNPSTRWSKAVTIFENDERFKAVERDRDRRDMFDSFLEELINKERAKAQEERKRNITEYRKLLESCDFIKANTQWRKVQDRLEADERCSRLEKIDRLEIFQDYLRDLEKEEEEQKKLLKEELRKTERKNRDEFRKLMEEHVAAGILTAKTHWRDYHMKVKDLPAYLAVASNTSGSTAKDLFEDVAEELEKQYHDEKSRIKDAVKLAKITWSSTYTFEEFKSALSIDSPPISDFNLKLVFDELLERAKEKEEKEAKKRKRLADDFLHLLYSTKDITASSKWEDCITLIEDSQEFRSVGDDNRCKEIFEEYITQLKEQAKEGERKRKEERAKKEKDREEKERRKSKQRREKEGVREREKDKADSDSADLTEKGDSKNKRRQHQSPEHTSHELDKERSKKSHGHSSSDRKKSKRHSSGHESDEGRHKRHKRDHRGDPHREGGYAEAEDDDYGKDVDRW
ncbi:hypothetical protein Ahy_A09g042244 isoform B [Arachis hypogaea]|uniref:Pre-mRNA-processing protein n=1 Tax=Arachis hypogaea TaxID=3818 RepID=A0A445BF78_ARAHY|nr:hypothetical protein Ahy_A09g042244 isoform B [Arachis hypogaea]